MIPSLIFGFNPLQLSCMSYSFQSFLNLSLLFIFLVTPFHQTSLFSNDCREWGCAELTWDKEDCCFMPYFGEVSIAVDNWRSFPEGSWEDNFGIYASGNFGARVPYFDRFGVGVQAGSSFGVYDFAGRGSSYINSNKTQKQLFLTAGMFRQAPDYRGLNLALVYDGMVNWNFGAFAMNPYLSQIRFLASFQDCFYDEIGVFGTLSTNTAYDTIFGYQTKFCAISQINLFWRHTYQNFAQTNIWVGMPYKNGLTKTKELPGIFIIGACFSVPLNENWNIEGHGVYMHPNSKNDIFSSRSYASNVSFGLTYTFGGKYTPGVQPLLPLASNSNFLVDSNFSY